MAKRGAENYLTNENFDDEDAEEERGTFEQASGSSLQNRDIKKAKRRVIYQDGKSPAAGAFQAFTGFNTTKSSTTPSFAFGSITNKPFTSVTTETSAENANKIGSTVSKNITVCQSSASSAGASASFSAPPAAAFGFGYTGPTCVPVAAASTNKKSTSSSSLSDYHRELKDLNDSVLHWIEQHVRLDPTCILSPIFTDYNRYVEELDKKYPIDNTYSKSSDSIVGSKSPEGSNKAKANPSSPPTNKNGFATSGLFGTTSSQPTNASSGQFTFGSNSVASTGAGFFATSTANSLTGPPATSSSFCFGANLAKPVVSATVVQQGVGGSSSVADGEDDEYVPPKPEIVEIKEDDAFYTVKCKLFYKKETIWQERGVGNLFLKPCAGGRTQLLIRADTNLGNILLNIVLNKSIPMARQGNNNVSLICVPNPQINEKNKDDKTPICLLMRVKTAAAADELLDKLNNHKN